MVFSYRCINTVFILFFSPFSTACGTGTGYVEGVATSDSASCPACGVGQYSDDTDNTACKSHSSPTCTSGQGTVAGSASTDTVCGGCTMGTYSDEVAAAPCKSHSSPSCAAGVGSVAGTASTDTICTPCGAGQFSTDTDGSACTENTCPGGKYLSSEANEAQVCTSACVPGKYKDGGCLDCKSGTYTSGTDESSCSGTECAKGAYGPASQTTPSAATCDPCSAGTYSDATGETSCKVKTTTGAANRVHVESPTVFCLWCENVICVCVHSFTT